MPWPGATLVPPGVQYGEQVFSSLSAAGKAIAGHATNGWKFWQPVEQDQE